MALLKSTNLNLRIAPEVREALREAAERDHRSISNMIELLIVQHCQRSDIPIIKPQAESKETDLLSRAIICVREN